MEEDDGLHGNLSQVRVIQHEVSVEASELLGTVSILGVRVCLYEHTNHLVP